jgi:uncharacterized protein
VTGTPVDMLWLLAAGAALAGFVQGLSGFAFAMVAMSLWVWGVEPRIAAVMAVFGGLSGQLLQAATVRRPFEWRAVAPFLLGAAVGMPLGVALLPQLDASLFRLVIGCVLVVVCPAMLFAHRLPTIDAGGRLGDGAAGAVGGFLGGIGGFSGVVPTVWCTLRGFERDRQRSVIQNFNLAALAATFATYVASGAVTRDMLLPMAVVLPALIVPSLLGARVYVGLSEQAFRRVVLTLLTAAGMAMIVSSLPTLR